MSSRSARTLSAAKSVGRRGHSSGGPLPALTCNRVGVGSIGCLRGQERGSDVGAKRSTDVAGRGCGARTRARASCPGPGSRPTRGRRRTGSARTSRSGGRSRTLVCPGAGDTLRSRQLRSWASFFAGPRRDTPSLVCHATSTDWTTSVLALARFSTAWPAGPPITHGASSSLRLAMPRGPRAPRSLRCPTLRPGPPTRSRMRG